MNGSQHFSDPRRTAVSERWEGRGGYRLGMARCLISAGSVVYGPAEMLLACRPLRAAPAT
jgi:hypothetical protein